MRKALFPPYSLPVIIFLTSLVLFFCSSWRHAIFQSNAFDLGIFDNGIYLISQGEKPFVTFRGIHILGDHAAWILYPIALLYKLYPDVHWLFAVQAIALSVGAIPTQWLALQAGLKPTQANLMAIVYLLYPLIFNVNLFDFHPEVIALPLLLVAVYQARAKQVLWFSLTVLVILGCKAVLSLTVAAMGVWLFLFENRRRCGAIAIILGLTWFIIATGIIIPHFSGGQPEAVARYGQLGNSVTEIAKNLFLKPRLVARQLFTLANLEYLLLLILPLLWGLSPRHLTPIIGGLPILALNLLSSSLQQKNLTQHYSLPILPFLLLAVISSLRGNSYWLRHPRHIMLWSLVAFLALAKYGYFWSRYLQHFDTVAASREAVALVNSPGSVLTADHIAPHLTHRHILMLATQGAESLDLTQFEWVLLNSTYPGWNSSQELVEGLIVEVQKIPEFQLRYSRDGVFLFHRDTSPKN